MISTQIFCLISGATAGVVRSIQGWLESTDPFNAKLFLYSLVRTTIQGAAAGFALSQEPIAVFFEVYFTDSLIVNRSINKVKEKIEGKTNGQ